MHCMKSTSALYRLWPNIDANHCCSCFLCVFLPFIFHFYPTNLYLMKMTHPVTTVFINYPHIQLTPKESQTKQDKLLDFVVDQLQRQILQLRAELICLLITVFVSRPSSSQAFFQHPGLVYWDLTLPLFAVQARYNVQWTHQGVNWPNPT